MNTGTISDMGILFPTSDGSDKYCFEHLNPAVSEPSLLDNEYMVKLVNLLYNYIGLYFYNL